MELLIHQLNNLNVRQSQTKITVLLQHGTRIIRMDAQVTLMLILLLHSSCTMLTYTAYPVTIASCITSVCKS